MTDFQMFINDDTLAKLTPAQRLLNRQAADHVITVLGPAPANGHAVRKGESGPCRICGNVVKLTFEHVPPRSSGNVHPRRAVDLATDLRSTTPGTMPRSGWTQSQRGSGMYATCGSCNSLGGKLYVPAYSDAVAASVGALKEWAEESEDDGFSGAPEFLKLTTSGNFFPGAVVRQALFMLMAMSGSAGLSSRYPILRRIVLHNEAHPLPNEFRIRLSLVIAQRIRVHPVIAEVDLKKMDYRAVLEVAHTPFAWLAEIGPTSERSSPDVSSWTKFTSADAVDVDLKLPVGSIVTALPADYRHPWQLPTETPIAETCAHNYNQHLRRRSR